MESIVAIISLVIVVSLFALVASVTAGKRAIGGSSAKFPPAFSSSLSKQEVLAAVVKRLENMQSLRFKWKVVERVDKIGRLQAMTTVPYNISGQDIKISFLLNMSATSRESGGCGVEWSYVMMSPISATPPEISMWEEKIYKQTTLEIRAALFTAQGDADVADFVEEQALVVAQRSGAQALPIDDLSKKPTDQPLESDRKEKENIGPETSLPAPVAVSPLDAATVCLPDIVEAELHSLGSANTDFGKTPMHVAQSIPGTALPDLASEELASLGSSTKGYPSLMAVPEVQMQMPAVDNSLPGVETPPGEFSNPLNFAPASPIPSAGSPATNESKCLKCSQPRDPSFNFCLYCGHSDA